MRLHHHGSEGAQVKCVHCDHPEHKHYYEFSDGGMTACSIPGCLCKEFVDKDGLPLGGIEE